MRHRFIKSLSRWSFCEISKITRHHLRERKSEKDALIIRNWISCTENKWSIENFRWERQGCLINNRGINYHATSLLPFLLLPSPIVFFFFFLSLLLSHNCLAVIQPDRKFTCWFWNATGPKDFRFIMEIFNYLIIIHRRPSRNTQIIPRNYSRESLLKSTCPPPPIPPLSLRRSSLLFSSLRNYHRKWENSHREHICNYINFMKSEIELFFCFRGYHRHL